MPNNTDLREDLDEEMVLKHTEGDGTKLYMLPVLGLGEQKGDYLYRSMDFDEAKNFLGGEWMPDESGIPWSTNQVYSLENYLKGPRTVQVEVPAHDIIERMKQTGTSPKFEGDGETWGVGPKAELGRKASKPANKSLKALHGELTAQGLIDSDFPSSKQFNKAVSGLQNEYFRAMFKDKLGQGRVVARRFPA